MTTAADALAALDLLASAGVAAWVDGGWGVDALLGEQTRDHHDLDLVIDAADVVAARAALTAAGFLVERNWLPTALALRHPDGRAVDLHPVGRTADGGGDQTLLDGGRSHYAAPATGRIGGRVVRCVDLATQLRCHLGYEPDANDRVDVLNLAARFGVSLPPPYAE